MKTRRHVLMTGASAVMAMLCRPATAGGRTAQDILTEVDKIRNPDVPFRVLNTIVEYRGGQPQKRLVLIVFAKEDKASGQFRNLVRFADPPADAGKLVLSTGSAMWFYDPAAKSTVRISPQQRLIGQASNGDVLNINLSKDYAAKLIGEETIQDSSRQDRVCARLELTAASETAIYNRCEFWVETATDHPIKAKFYSDSGRLLKIVYYGNYREQVGATRPTEAVIIDAVDSELVTKMTMTDYKAVAIPDAWFQRDYLPRFNPD